MAWKKIIIDKVNFSKEVVSFTKSGVYFSAEFIKKNSLEKK